MLHIFHPRFSFSTYVYYVLFRQTALNIQACFFLEVARLISILFWQFNNALIFNEKEVLMAEHEIKFNCYFLMLLQTKKKVCASIIQV